MYYVDSELAPKEYLAELKRSFASPFLIYDERVCGIIIGPFFSIAYHSPYEWNRRITGEVNRAWGYVKNVEGKSHITFLRGKGAFAPIPILLTTMFCLAIFAFSEWSLIMEDLTLCLLVSGAISLVACGITAIQSMLTEQGEAGRYEISKLLSDPKNYYC